MAQHEAEIFIYKNEAYRRYPTSPNHSDASYYKISRSNKKHEYLHRVTYKDHYGDIPENFHIHHKDGNPSNNSPENLECLSPEDHVRLHPWDSERYKWQVALLDRIRPMTKAWHSSEEGHEFHVKIGGMAYKDFTPSPKECKHCGDVFLTKKLGHTDLFCSNPCKSAWRRAEGLDDVEKICENCGNVFRVNKYKKTQTCSRSCGQSMRRKKNIS